MNSSPSSVDAIGEKSRLLLTENNPKQAIKTAMIAVENQAVLSPVPLLCKKKGLNTFTSIAGVIRSYIAQRNYVDARTQMDFLQATFRDVEKTVVGLGV